MHPRQTVIIKAGHGEQHSAGLPYSCGGRDDGTYQPAPLKGVCTNRFRSRITIAAAFLAAAHSMRH